MPEFVYQLRATGRAAFFESRMDVFTSTVFRTREAAEKRIQTFRQMVIDRDGPNGLMALEDDERLKIDVHELEIIEEEG